MRNTNLPNRGFYFPAIALLAGAWLVVICLGRVSDLPALRTVGIAVLALAAVLALVLAAHPIFAFFAFLDWIGFLPLSRFLAWVKQRREQAEAAAQKRAGPEVFIENQYRFFAVRKDPIADARELRRVVARLVRRLQLRGSSDFTLYGYTPVMQKRRVTRFGFSRVGYFLERSQIRWNFGREHSDPTHELLFFSRFNGTHSVYLRISFVTPSGDATCPGLFAELRLTPAALGVGGPYTMGHVESFFQILVKTLDADSGHVELPGQPECQNWPHTPGDGPLLYTVIAAEAALYPGATVKPCGRGSLLIAPPEATCENLNLSQQS